MRAESNARCLVAFRRELVDAVHVDERIVEIEQRDDRRGVIDLVRREDARGAVDALFAHGTRVDVRRLDEQPERGLAFAQTLTREDAIDFRPSDVLRSDRCVRPDSEEAIVRQ